MFLLFLLFFNTWLLYFYELFTTCLLLFTMLLLLLYYMFTTCSCMITTSLLHVCYFVFCYSILFVFDILLLLLTTFEFYLYHVLIFLYICYGQTPPLVLVPSSHYYLGSLSWTSRTFYFSDSRDLIEVLRGLPWQRETPREDPLGSGRIP